MINDEIKYKASNGAEAINQPYTINRYIAKHISGATGAVRKDQILEINTCVSVGGVHRTNRIIDLNRRIGVAPQEAMTTAWRARRDEARANNYTRRKR